MSLDNRFYREPQAADNEDLRYDEDGSHLYWFDPVEGCWVAFKRVDCVGEEELPERRLPATPAPQGEPSDAAVKAGAEAMREQGPANTPIWDDWVWERFSRAALRAAAEAEGGNR